MDPDLVQLFFHATAAFSGVLTTYALQRLLRRLWRGKRLGSSRLRFQVERHFASWTPAWWQRLTRRVKWPLVWNALASVGVGTVALSVLSSPDFPIQYKILVESGGVRLELAVMPMLAAFGAGVATLSTWLSLGSSHDLLVGFEKGMSIQGRYYSYLDVHEVKISQGQVSFHTDKKSYHFDVDDLEAIANSIRPFFDFTLEKRRHESAKLSSNTKERP